MIFAVVTCHFKNVSTADGWFSPSTSGTPSAGHVHRSDTVLCTRSIPLYTKRNCSLVGSWKREKWQKKTLPRFVRFNFCAVTLKAIFRRRTFQKHVTCNRTARRQSFCRKRPNKHFKNENQIAKSRSYIVLFFTKTDIYIRAQLSTFFFASRELLYLYLFRYIEFRTPRRVALRVQHLLYRYCSRIPYYTRMGIVRLY